MFTPDELKKRSVQGANNKLLEDKEGYRKRAISIAVKNKKWFEVAADKGETSCKIYDQELVSNKLSTALVEYFTEKGFKAHSGSEQQQDYDNSSLYHTHWYVLVSW